MNPAAEILVIILSVFLAIFLVLGIILIIYLIDLTCRIRRISKSAENTFEEIESVVSGFSKIVPSMIVTEMIAKIISKFKSKGE